MTRKTSVKGIWHFMPLTFYVRIYFSGSVTQSYVESIYDKGSLLCLFIKDRKLTGAFLVHDQPREEVLEIDTDSM